MIERFLIYWSVFRSRGKARVDHRLWLYWSLFGRYPKHGTK